MLLQSGGDLVGYFTSFGHSISLLYVYLSCARMSTSLWGGFDTRLMGDWLICWASVGTGSVSRLTHTIGKCALGCVHTSGLHIIGAPVFGADYLTLRPRGVRFKYTHAAWWGLDQVNHRCNSHETIVLESLEYSPLALGAPGSIGVQ